MKSPVIIITIISRNTRRRTKHVDGKRSVQNFPDFCIAYHWCCTIGSSKTKTNSLLPLGAAAAIWYPVRDRSCGCQKCAEVLQTAPPFSLVRGSVAVTVRAMPRCGSLSYNGKGATLTEHWPNVSCTHRKQMSRYRNPTDVFKNSTPRTRPSSALRHSDPRFFSIN